MKRKNVVCLIHEFLRRELKEADEFDVSPAYSLQDLFDCRVCAGHVMQVYVKGIMDGVTLPDGRVIFDAEKQVSPEEWSDIMTKVCFPEFRTQRFLESDLQSGSEEPKEITLKQVMRLLREKKDTIIVDVRTEREYAEGCLQDAINVPMLSVMKNPFMFSENRNKIILLYCNEGYQSKAAAQCLLEAGYQKVAFFVYKTEQK